MKFPASYKLVWFPKSGGIIKGSVALYNFHKDDWISLFGFDYELNYNDCIEISIKNSSLIENYLPRNFSFEYDSFNYYLQVFQSAEERAYKIRNKLILPLQAAIKENETLKLELKMAKKQLSATEKPKTKRKIAV